MPICFLESLQYERFVATGWELSTTAPSPIPPIPDSTPQPYPPLPTAGIDPRPPQISDPVPPVIIDPPLPGQAPMREPMMPGVTFRRQLH